MNTIKAKIGKSVRFVKNHKLALACTATSAATYWVVRDLKVKGAKESTETLFCAAAHDHVLLHNAYDFLDLKGLGEEFDNFALSQVE